MATTAHLRVVVMSGAGESERALGLRGHWGAVHSAARSPTSAPRCGPPPYATHQCASAHSTYLPSHCQPFTSSAQSVSPSRGGPPVAAPYVQRTRVGHGQHGRLFFFQMSRSRRCAIMRSRHCSQSAPLRSSSCARILSPESDSQNLRKCACVATEVNEPRPKAHALSRATRYREQALFDCVLRCHLVRAVQEYYCHRCRDGAINRIKHVVGRPGPTQRQDEQESGERGV